MLCFDDLWSKLKNYLDKQEKIDDTSHMKNRFALLNTVTNALTEAIPDKRTRLNTYILCKILGFLSCFSIYPEKIVPGIWKLVRWTFRCVAAGEGVAQDTSVAAKWYRPAADQGHDMAVKWKYNFWQIKLKLHDTDTHLID